MTYARASAAGGLMLTFNDSRIGPQYYLRWSLLREPRDPWLAGHPDLKFRVCLKGPFGHTRSSGERCPRADDLHVRC
jgi:hypothetical protein